MNLQSDCIIFHQRTSAKGKTPTFIVPPDESVSICLRNSDELRENEEHFFCVICVSVRPKMMRCSLVVSINTDLLKQSDLYTKCLHISSERLHEGVD